MKDGNTTVLLVAHDKAMDQFFDDPAAAGKSNPACVTGTASSL